MAAWLKDIGKKGEDLAVTYLKGHGYKIIEQNFQKRYGEIDIVAKDGNTLVFIEVKTRSSSQFGSPLEAITPWKMKALTRSAYFYKNLHPDLPESLRIDVVSVLLSPSGVVEKIELVKNITG